MGLAVVALIVFAALLVFGFTELVALVCFSSEPKLQVIMAAPVFRYPTLPTCGLLAQARLENDDLQSGFSWGFSGLRRLQSTDFLDVT